MIWRPIFSARFRSVVVPAQMLVQSKARLQTLDALVLSSSHRLALPPAKPLGTFTYPYMVVSLNRGYPNTDPNIL